MRRFQLLLLFLATGMAFPKEKVVWPAIPPQVWALKEDAAHGIQGAVVLEDRYEVLKDELVRTLRVRILSDQGRDAANLFLFMGETPDIQGRTVYPDGRVVAFDTLKDFNTKVMVETSRSKAKRTAVIPPGVNGDCVLEVRWVEPPLGGDSGRSIWYLGGKYQVQRAEVFVARDLPRSHQIIPGKGVKVEVEAESNGRRFILRDLPAQEEIPYGLTVTRDLPRIVVFLPQVDRALSKKFKQIASPRERADLFWSEFVAEDLKERYEQGWRTGDAYKALREELFKGLPETPHARATALLMRLNARIRNRDQSTFAEIAADKGIKNWSDWLDYRNVSYRHHNLEIPAELKVSTNNGMWYLYFYLAREAGLHPKIGLVSDRDVLLFDYDTLDANQFSDRLLGIEEPGKGILWVDPALRFTAPGVIDQDYQGTQGLLVDTDSWQASPFRVPVQPALTNQRQFHFEVTPEEEGERFSVLAEFAGIPDRKERNRFLAYDSKGQARLLKEGFEGLTKRLSITSAEVMNAQDPLSNVSWKAEGRLEIEPTRLKQVVPFPGMPSPLWVPETLPNRRAEPILLPYRSTHLAVSQVVVPEGYRLAPIQPVSQRNRFGAVNWLAATEQKDGRVTVKVLFRVDVQGFYEPPEAYEELKAFLGWVREGLRKTLILERSR